MRTTAQTALVMLLAGSSLTVASAVLAAPANAAQGCRYYYTSVFLGPEGQTTGSGTFAEGDMDPEGRVCESGWWVHATSDEAQDIVIQPRHFSGVPDIACPPGQKKTPDGRCSSVPSF